MFTGLIVEIGKVKHRIGNTICIAAQLDLKVGGSISVNGVCLTVTKKDSNSFCADLLDETIKRTNLGRLRMGEPVNLELALKVGDRLAGHIVTGHVDCTGKILRRYRKGNDVVLEVETIGTIAKALVTKGSVAVNGVSLTIASVRSNRFIVYLITHTLEKSNLGQARIVNIETDKYLHT